MSGLESIIISLSYLGVFLVMIINGIIGFPSSQILYAIAGYFVYEGHLIWGLVIAAGALGNTIGNYILYEAARKKGKEYSIKFIRFMFQLSDPKKEIDKFQTVFNKKQTFWLFVGKLVNPIKVFIPIPAGIAKVNRIKFLIIVYITSAIWALIFTTLGYFFGRSYEDFGIFGVIIFLIAISIMAYFYKLMNSKEIIEEVEKKNKY